jgi:hypothetical protein
VPAALAAILVAVLAAAAITIIVLSRRRPPLPPEPSWTRAAGDEFDRLSAAERCDLVFAVAALEDDASRGLLLRALDDPAEAVALAAARSLAQRGEGAILDRYLAQRSDERTRALRLLVEILD